MTCPPEIAEVIAQILQAGLLRVRALGWSGNAARCAIEADHLHNLPVLLGNYSDELLRFYWQVERQSYLAQSGVDSVPEFEVLWKRLEPLVPNRLATAQVA
jgi:hypothetical protein